MNKLIILLVILVIIVAIFYPKRVGGPLCGPLCPPVGLKSYERDCLGVKNRRNVIDGFTDYCYGIPWGQIRCYGDEETSSLKNQEVLMACPEWLK